MSRTAGPVAVSSSVSRGFTVSHQKVALELGLAPSSPAVLGGYTELTIVPTDKHLKTVFLNSRQCTIQSVTCCGQDAEFSLHDSLTAVTTSDSRDVHLAPELKRKLYAAASDGQGGELAIILPLSVRPDAQQPNKEPIPSEPSFSPLDTPAAGSIVAASAEANTITICIYYSLSSPVDAIQVVQPSGETPWRQTHMFTSPTCSDYARCWLPCVDSLWERNTWEFQYVVSRTIAETEGQDVLERDEANECIVISTGDLVEKTIHPHNSRKVIFTFFQGAATSVQHVGFAAGCFKAIDLCEKTVTDLPISTASEADDGSELQMITFCLPGREEELRISTAVARQAMTHFSRDFGSFPFASFKLVFVEDTVVDVHNLSTLAILSADLLHAASIIDQAFETRQVIAHSLAVQWVGINIIQKTWSDTWLINGLSLYVSGIFWRRLMGNNEYRFRLRKDCDRVCAWDIGMPPIGQLGMQEPPDTALLPFINLKASLVLHILDRRLCKAGASLGLGRVIPRVLLQAITGDLPNNMLSTSSFLRTCRKVSGVDLRKFAEQWIHGSGCPRFLVSSNFNRKKLLIEIHVRQETPAALFAEYRPEQAVGSNPVKLFEGQMTIRIHEADGRPYEHVLDLKTIQKRYDVPFNTKYKRVRRNTKRFQARQAAAAAAAEGDQDAAEAMGMIDLGFSLAMWEDEKQRDRWKVADWTEEEEDVMSQAAYEWIRMDADFEWIASIHVDQPDYMWVSQLQRDRDVVAQLQAVEALALLPTALSSSMLTRTVLVSTYFFRIRTEAAQALVNCATPQLAYIGLFHLLMLFKTSYCIDTHESLLDGNVLDMLCIPQANDFTNLADYFIRRAIVQAISRVRNERGRTLPQVKRFLLNQIKYNDNSTNRYLDDYYLATLLSSLATAFVPLDSPIHGNYVPTNEDPDALDDVVLLQHALSEVSRLQELDKLVPSYHNVITLACLAWQAAMILSHELPLDLRPFLAYTQQGTFPPVRTAAFNYLLILSGLKHKIVVRYLFTVLRSDADRAVKRDLAQGICEALTIAIATGDAPGLRMDAVTLEKGHRYDACSVDRTRDKEMEATLRALRREVGRSATVREGFLGALLAAAIDSEARWSLIKLAEILFKPKEESELPLEARIVTARGRCPTPHLVVEPLASADLQVPVGATGSFNASAHGRVSNIAAAQDAIELHSTARVAFEDGVKESAATSLRPTLKIKKAKSVPQAQVGGMSAADVTACRNALKKLYSNVHSFLFINPVDPVRDSAPNYHQIVKDPMDLSSMSNKVEAGLYSDRFSFEKDFALLVVNAKTYTPDPMAFVHKEADALSKAFQTLWAKTNKTLEQAAAKQAALAAGNSGDHGASVIIATASTAPALTGPMAPPPLPIRVPARPTVPAIVASPQNSAGAVRPLGLKLKLKPKLSVDSPLEATFSTPIAKPSAVPPASDAVIPRSASGEGSLRATPPTKVKAKSQRTTPRAGSACSPAPTARSTEGLTAASGGLGNLPPLSTVPGEDLIKIGKDEPIHTKQCKTLLQNLRRLPEAILFLAPVDEAIAPGYHSIVHSPMDLDTMELKLNSNRYATMDQFAKDMVQIFDNAYIYADVTAVRYAETVRAAFRKEWPKALVRRLEYNDRRALQSMISRVKGSYLGGLFAQPVEEIVKALPHYHSVIPEGQARDLVMIGDKLKNDRYGRASEIEADIRLMIQNAKTFNAANEAVLSMVEMFEQFFNKEWRSTTASLSIGAVAGAGGKKRKEEETKGKEGAAKRQKA